MPGRLPHILRLTLIAVVIVAVVATLALALFPVGMLRGTAERRHGGMAARRDGETDLLEYAVSGSEEDHPVEVDNEYGGAVELDDLILGDGAGDLGALEQRRRRLEHPRVARVLHDEDGGGEEHPEDEVTVTFKAGSKVAHDMNWVSYVKESSMFGALHGAMRLDEADSPKIITHGLTFESICIVFALSLAALGGAFWPALLVALLHLQIDFAKARLGGQSLGPFLADQAAHGVAIEEVPSGPSDCGVRKKLCVQIVDGARHDLTVAAAKIAGPNQATVSAATELTDGIHCYCLVCAIHLHKRPSVGRRFRWVTEQQSAGVVGGRRKQHKNIVSIEHGSCQGRADGNEQQLSPPVAAG